MVLVKGRKKGYVEVFLTTQVRNNSFCDIRTRRIGFMRESHFCTLTFYSVQFFVASFFFTHDLYVEF